MPSTSRAGATAGAGSVVGATFGGIGGEEIRMPRLAAPSRTRVALLVSPASFEGFYADQLGLDRRSYVDAYRNDFVWTYAEGLRAHGVDVVAYIAAHDEGGHERADDGFEVRF